jgi:peptide/nickel transport system substrate-binding protein
MRVKGAALAISAALFLCAAGGAPPCGTLVIPTGIGQSAPEAPASFNPLIDNTLGSQQLRLLLYRPLVWIGQDDRFDHERSLAESVQALDGNTVFRVTLKPWRWSDGTTVTADDVVFAWELIRKLGPRFAYQDQGGVPGWIAGVTAVDSSHVDFQLKQPANPDWFVLNGLANIAPLPRHAWGNPDVDRLWRHQNDPAYFRVVDGPFLLTEFSPDRYAAFVPNPMYGGRHSALKRLVVAFPEGASALHDVQAGALDMAHVPLALWDKMRRTPGYHFTMLHESFGFRSLIFNLANPRVAFLRDVRVRQALTDAADQKAMMHLVYRDFSHEARAPMPAGLPQPENTPVRDDPALARRLLEEAGWVPGPDGVRVKAGTRLAFTALVPAEQPDRVQEMQILERNLFTLGVEMRLRLVSIDQLNATLEGEDVFAWEAGLLGWTVTGLPEAEQFFATGGEANMGRYSDATMDRLSSDLTSKSGPETLAAVEAYAAAQQPWNFLPEGGNGLMVADGVEGVADFVSPQGFWSPEYLYLSGNRTCSGT